MTSKFIIFSYYAPILWNEWYNGSFLWQK